MSQESTATGFRSDIPTPENSCDQGFCCCDLLLPKVTNCQKRGRLQMNATASRRLAAHSDKASFRNIEMPRFHGSFKEPRL